MSKTSLSELIAITQENIQRSYDFSNDLTEAYRLSNEENIILSLKEMKISIPIACDLQSVAESTIDPSADQEWGGLSFAEAVLRNPRMEPAKRLELRSAFLTNMQAIRSGEVLEAETIPAAERQPEAKQRGGAAKRGRKAKPKEPVEREELIVSLFNGKDSSEIEALQVGNLEMTFSASLR